MAPVRALAWRYQYTARRVLLVLSHHHYDFAECRFEPRYDDRWESATLIPRLVTFDCAQTLVEIPSDWSLGKLVVDAATQIGLKPPSGADKLYMKLYAGRLPEFFEINQTGDMVRAEIFWSELGLAWLHAIGESDACAEALRDAADELLFGPKSEVFKLYDDVVPCLDYLDSMGIQAAVISNWDYSLHRVLKMFGIYERFLVVKASLEEGVEKPDPRLFEIALEEAGFHASETFHVGDSHEDDFVGAKAASLRVALIDRMAEESNPPVLKSLLDLPEAFTWID